MMRTLLLVALSAALFGCSQKDESSVPAAASKQAPADPVAGKALAERECKGCHGLDGKGVAPAIPALAAQSERYLLAVLDAQRQGKRPHGALIQLSGNMSDADARNVAAYYASLPALPRSDTDAARFAPYESGKALSAGCAKCHGEDGNSVTPGTPSLAGQQPGYLVAAMQQYIDAERKGAPVHRMLRGIDGLEMQSLALYFSSQSPAERPKPSFGDPAAGAPLTTACSGCHGARGVSTDTATPNLAGQDPRYLVEAIKAYRTIRRRERMRAYVTGLGEKDIENIAAFYAVQKSAPAEKGQMLVQQLTESCDRCHVSGLDNPNMLVPKIRGQDQAYLVMALRAYRDDRRESSAMHKMSLPYGDALIESLASYYAGQPPK
jgi:cytochrome c553